MGRVIVDVELANHEDQVLAKAAVLAADKVRRVRVSGVVDSGATYLVLPKAVAEQLGVPVTGSVHVTYTDRRQTRRPVVGDVQVELLGRSSTFTAIVEPKRQDVLIGAVVLEVLDLLVDCRTQTLQPRDPRQIIAEIE